MLSDVVAKYVNRSGLSYAQIARNCDLPSKTTVSNWVNGYSKRPRDWQPLLQFARGVQLTEAEGLYLLCARRSDMV